MRKNDCLRRKDIPIETMKNKKQKTKRLLGIHHMYYAVIYVQAEVMHRRRRGASALDLIITALPRPRK
jgi:hypothetical protein